MADTPLEQPKPGKRGKKAGFYVLTFLVLALLAGLGYFAGSWYMSKPLPVVDEKSTSVPFPLPEKQEEQATDRESTFLPTFEPDEEIVDTTPENPTFTEEKPELPVVSRPAPESATPLAQSTVPDKEKPAVTHSVTMQAAVTQKGEDRIFTQAFIKDLACFLAGAYHPAGSRSNTGAKGRISMTFKQINMRYGTGLTGMDVSKDKKGRQQVLAYITSPVVLNLLYAGFADSFITALIQEGSLQEREFYRAKTKTWKREPLSKKQVQEMVALYAEFFLSQGQMFYILAANPDIVPLMDDYFQAGAALNAAYGQLEDKKAQKAPQKGIEEATSTIKKAIIHRERAQKAITKDLRNRGQQAGEIIDMGSWIYRRIKFRPANREAMLTLGLLSQKMSVRLSSAAGSR